MLSAALLIQPAASGFCPVQRPPPLRGPLRSKMATAAPFAFGLPGNLPPLGDFDPLNLLRGASREEVFRWRDCELVHGRIGMLASAGFIVQELWHPLFHSTRGVAFDQLQMAPPALLLAAAVAISTAEAARVGWLEPIQRRLQQLSSPAPVSADYSTAETAAESAETALESAAASAAAGLDEASQLRFDPFGLAPTEPQTMRAMEERELSHGRLGMLAAAGFVAQELATGDTWGVFWEISDSLHS
mmetsp:Transcript_2235/g.4658  ORF Transcript_2235/g.4658 Transcript_2235/m.4658 type:complete len:245 (-) Transcript_2235:648-1382(-)